AGPHGRFRRHPAKGSHVASAPLLPIGGGGGTPVGVRAAPRQRSPPLKIAPGRRGRRRTAPPPHFLLPQNPTCSFFLSPTAPAPPVSLQEHHPVTHPAGPSALVESQIRARFSRAAWPFSPARRPSPGFHRSAMPICSAAVAAGAAPLLPPQLMPCTADPLPQIGITADTPLLPRSLVPLVTTPSLRFTLFRGLPHLFYPAPIA
ncbi:unnamed protein product, partial [Urochloa humidicola]